MNREQALEVFQLSGVRGDADFHTLSSSEVDALLAQADRLKYRKPQNANGSRGRYFYAACQRALRRQTD